MINDSNNEKKFLHDISNPLTTAIFVLDMVLASADKGQEIDLEKLLKVQLALKKSQELIHLRRESLLQPVIAEV